MENEDHGSQLIQVGSKEEPVSKAKILYKREFLLSFAELDICKKLPAGCDASIISELQDSPHSVTERQRSSGVILQSSSNYSRGSYGKWDTRSSGSSDREGDSQSDRDTFSQDSGRRYGNQPRRSLQHPEHDGLLGSGTFPRPPGYTGGTASLKGRGGYPLNRTTEPYQPPRPYKALPHRRDHTDLCNDETFGSVECSSKDREEEEKKRRASFELMRKEQQTALQEKQKQNTSSNKENRDVDIMALLEKSDNEKEKHPLDKKNNFDNSSAPSDCKDDSPTSTVNIQAPVSRPLVPPGFASNAMDKNLRTKAVFSSSALEVPSGAGHDEEKVDQSVACMTFNEKHSSGSIPGSLADEKEKAAISTSNVKGTEYSTFFENSAFKTSGGEETHEAWTDGAVLNIKDKKVMRSDVTSTVSQETQNKSTSILDRLFGYSIPPIADVSPKFIEHDLGVKTANEEPWGAVPSQSSKFAPWFNDEDKKKVDDSTSRDLLSLIVSGEKSGSHGISVVDERKAENISADFLSGDNELPQKPVPSSASSVILGIPEPIFQDKPAASSGVVLTCEDLEQFILAEANTESSSGLQHTMQETLSGLDGRTKQKQDIDNHASQLLLSLLHNGASNSSESVFPNIDKGSVSKPGISEVKSVTSLNSTGGTAKNADQHLDSQKTVTLETLFGTAFMKELHSLEAPVSAQRGSLGGGLIVDAPHPVGLSFPHADNSLLHASVGEYGSNKSSYGNNPSVNHGKDQHSDSWLSSSERGTEDYKLGGRNGGFEDGAVDICLPEEESLISVADDINPKTTDFLHMGNATKAENLLPSQTPAEITDKLAALSAILKEERAMFDERSHLHGQFGPVEPELSHFNRHQMVNQLRPLMPPMEHSVHRNPPMKFVGPESIHHHPHQPFPGNNLHHPFHGQHFDNPAHQSMLQHLPPMPGNFPLPHLLQGPSMGMPPSHPMAHMPPFMPDLNPLQALSLNQRQPNFGVHGTGMPGSGGGNHPEALERLMELRGNSKQMLPLAGGPNPGFYGGPDLDMAFRYR
ncbi:hypothetical protein QJS04_geneDACA011536 [Acorus gramineus]|uniref:Uncharacterized protein n=1 Tax=Acorus gramineus TaxID=55184 RepID=A0AAV9ACP5_ACOGR|nr:hypothetical protein QJS04_geneDACA011536 [Acorus gramineus]